MKTTQNKGKTKLSVVLFSALISFFPTYFVTFGIYEHFEVVKGIPIAEQQGGIVASVLILIAWTLFVPSGILVTTLVLAKRNNWTKQQTLRFLFG